MSIRPTGWLRIVTFAALAFTLLVSVAPVVDLAYRAPSLHVAVETAAALISLLAAQLVYGRFRDSLECSDLLLTAALVVFAGTNLCFSAIPAAADLGQGPFSTWAPALGGALGAALLAAAAWAPPRQVRLPARAARHAVAACGLALLVIAAVIAAAGDWLPRAIDPALSPGGTGRPKVVGEPSVLALQLVVMALFAASAVGLARRAERKPDPLLLWFAIGATLGAFARLNYFVFPSVYSEYFYTGDVLRLGMFACLLIGGVQEIMRSQHELARAAVVNERRRIAREIHDGMAQDLAFIAQQADALAERNGDCADLADVATAARRALDESRIAINALVRPTDEPLADALTRVATQASGRWGAVAETRAEPGLELPVGEREALLRIVGEAVGNAARHAHPGRILVELGQQPQLHVSIRDDGIGFDPAATAGRSGHHGITGMRERAAQLGGRLRIASYPGEGTEVVVMLP